MPPPRTGWPPRRLLPAPARGAAGITLRNTLAALASGTTVTQGAGGNSGGGSGQFFDGVQIGSGSTLASDNSVSPRGGNSLKCATGITATTVFAAWSGSLSTIATTWSSFSFYADTLPGSVTRIWGAYTSAGTLCGQVQLATNGVLSIKNAAGGTLASSAAALSAATWYRLEPYIFGDSANGVLALRIYPVLDGYTPSETLYGSGAALTGPPGSWRFGISGLNVANVSLHYGDIAVSSAGPIGPAPALVIFPSPADPSTGATDSWAATDSGAVLVSDSDAATGTDAGEALTAQASPGDSATGTDAGESTGIASADTGTAAETAQLFQSSADTATAADTTGTLVVSAADTGTAADTTGFLRLQAADSATGTEQLPSTAVSSAEALTGADSAALKVTGTETASAAEAASVATISSISSADTAAFTEAAFTGITSADTATAAESAGITLRGTDTATTAEIASLALSAGDTATAADTAALGIASADSGALADAASLALSAGDTATAAEIAQLGIASGDFATATDAALLELLSADTATGADYGFQSGPIGPDGDTGSFTEAEVKPVTVAVAVLAMDVAVFADALAVTVAVLARGTDSATVNAGQQAIIRVRATNPVNSELVKDATATAYLFAPPKDPQARPADRTPDHTVALAYDPASNYYTGTADTAGFAPGTWWCQGVVSGGAGGVNGWQYQSFTVEA